MHGNIPFMQAGAGIIKRYGDRPSVSAWANCRIAAAAGLLLWAQPTGNIGRLLHSTTAATGECGQCDVVSVRSS